MIIFKKIKQYCIWADKHVEKSYEEGNHDLFLAVNGVFKECNQKTKRKKIQNVFQLKEIKKYREKKVGYSDLEIHYYAKRLDALGVKCHFNNNGWNNYRKTRTDNYFNEQKLSKKEVALDIQHKIDLYFWNPPIAKISIADELNKIKNEINILSPEGKQFMICYMKHLNFLDEEGNLNPNKFEKEITQNKHNWFSFLRRLEKIWDKISKEREKDKIDYESDDEIQYLEENYVKI